MKAIEIIGVLSLAREPVTLEKLAKMSGASKKEVSAALSEFSQFVVVDKAGLYSIKVDAELPEVDIARVREEMADNLWSDMFGSE
jgi:DNA-binding transcriptional regulator GbsR (MarR family)